MIRFLRCALLLALCALVQAQAGVMPERTRLVLSQGVSEVRLRVANTNAYPVMLQSWVDQGEGSQAPDTVVSSMFAMPGVQRLPPQAISAVRLLYTGDPLPAGRESVFWLNLYEIPVLPADGTAQGSRVLLGLNTQIKVFYRPPGLPDPDPRWFEALHFRLEREAGQWVLVCRNDSAYYASLAGLQLSDGQAQYTPRQGPDMMAPPFGEMRYSLPRSSVDHAWREAHLRYQLIDDSGLAHEQQVTLASPILP
ncbi:fimbrial biogenesis chaperone [Herbaspirillum seropedicae]|uniref:fimbrial biogenesis chaperone n=1 Tax=Herbaspirillum seropedicae TaxID=964 RepID=UPI002863F42B|nr:molecular chaperone [Herbaspirillum seropedicae]MDR6395407.1 P pilus assembly chaperone PapD [Herbaspirillum seropedicae]